MTERTYFRGIRTELRSNLVRIEIGPSHSEPLTLVQAGVAHLRRAPNSESDRYEAYDHVWCVFDVEAPPPKTHPAIDQAVALARKSGVRCAVSNPCFELWLLLHFRDQRAYLTTDEACSQLERSDCGYSCRTKQVNYDAVRPRRLAAVERAVVLNAQHDVDAILRRRNPWTSVHQLVEELFRNA